MEIMLVSEERDMALAAADAAVSLLAIDQYLRQVHWTAPLTQEEETALFERLERSRQAPDDAWRASLAHHARERLVEAYQPAVIRNAKQFARLPRVGCMEYMDCVQEGNLGLLAAVEQYRVSYDVAFDAFAVPYIRHRILKAVRYQASVIRLSARLHEQIASVEKARKRLSSDLGRCPTESELARAAGMKEQKVHDVLAYAQYLLVESIEGLLQENDRSEDCFPFTQLYESSASSSFSVDIVEVVEQTVQTVLTPRQREVMQLRYGLHGTLPHTMAEASKRLGFQSLRSVQNSERIAKKRLQEVLAPMLDKLAS